MLAVTVTSTGGRPELVVRAQAKLYRGNEQVRRRRWVISRRV